VTEKVTEKQAEIIHLLGGDPTLTVLELSSMIRMSRKGILENIAKLKRKGLLRRVGPDKGGRWEVM